MSTRRLSVSTRCAVIHVESSTQRLVTVMAAAAVCRRRRSAASSQTMGCLLPLTCSCPIPRQPIGTHTSACDRNAISGN
jgi:hypothetical protein